MGWVKPYSNDLRERVVAAVESGGLSCRQAAARFGLGVSTAINWVRRKRETGSVAPGKMGGLQAESDRGQASQLAVGARQGEGLHLARAGRRTCRARSAGRLPYGLGLRSCREAELQKKPWWLANAIVRTSHAGAPNGSSTRTASSLTAWSSSTRLGPGPTWRRCAAGRRGAGGSSPRCRTAAGGQCYLHGRPAPQPDRSAHGSSKGRSMAKASAPTSRKFSFRPFDPVTSSSWTISAVTSGNTIRQLIRSAGAKLFFLPKYSPDLNPIEQVFAKLKHLLRKAAARSVEAICSAIGQLLGAFTAKRMRQLLPQCRI